MCIVIDTDALGRVFRATNKEHGEFKPVLDWVLDGQGVVVYGGSTYSGQLARAERYVPLLTELRRYGKVHVAQQDEVDARERVVRETLRDPQFNDQHIVAILLVTGCRLVCTADKQSHKFIANREFFPNARNRPRFYGGRKDKRVLCSRNIPSTFNRRPRLGKAAKQELTAKLP